MSISMTRVLGALLFVATTTASGAQERNFINIEFNHNMSINGETAQAKGTGYGELNSGVMVIDFQISNLIDGYRGWASSIVTNAGGGGGPIVAATAEGGPTSIFQTLASQEVRSLSWSKLTQDDFADLKTEFNVRFNGETLSIEVETSGSAKYPELVGMADVPMVYKADRGADGIVESLGKQLMTAEGEMISTDVTIAFPPQTRRAEGNRTTIVKPLKISDDGLEITLMYHNRFE